MLFYCKPYLNNNIQRRIRAEHHGGVLLSAFCCRTWCVSVFCEMNFQRSSIKLAFTLFTLFMCYPFPGLCSFLCEERSCSVQQLGSSDLKHEFGVVLSIVSSNIFKSSLHVLCSARHYSFFMLIAVV